MSAKKTVRGSRFDQVFGLCNVTMLILIVIAMMYPLYYTIIASFSDPYRVLRGEVLVAIRGFTLDSYNYLFQEKLIWSGYLNSIFITATGTVYALAVTIPCAYALSRKLVKGRMVIMTYFVITMYFSGGMIPSYVLIKQLGLIDSTWSLILPAAFSAYNMIITRTFYQSTIPDEFYEAAKIDGASEFQIFFRIALPLSTAIMAVIALYVAVGHWNSYFSALIYINTPGKYPLQLVLRAILIMNQQIQSLDVSSISDSEELADLMRRQMISQTMKYSLVIVASLPMLMFYPFIQKYFVKGVMIGGLKG
ncbi:MAG: carbohydrate ABC transporter permease [Clostridiaceae bacterium]|nr:carbohydrate ABC transporter permease [Clostridiaceae bacterium]